MAKQKTVATENVIKTKYELAKDRLKEILYPLFAREETRLTAISYVHGLLSMVGRKNSWQLSAESGLSTPYAFQYLLGRARWNEDKLQELISAEVYSQLGSNGILAVDETGFLKKGDKSAGVARQYSGTAGRIENSQIGVFLSYMTPLGRSLIDRELYLPKEWINDKDRRNQADIPIKTEFKTKPELAVQMLKQAFANGIEADWVVGDNVYGCYSLRSYLQGINQQYVLAVPSNQQVYIGVQGFKVNEIIPMVTKWHKVSAGNGTKGPRFYQWASIEINSLDSHGHRVYLLMRKSITNQKEIAYYITFARDSTTFDEIVAAAGSRWSIEECFEVAKSEVGLDQYEVRSYIGWYRHITLSLLAMVFLNQLNITINKKIDRIDLKKNHRNIMRGFLQKRGLG